MQVRGAGSRVRSLKVSGEEIWGVVLVMGGF